MTLTYSPQEFAGQLSSYAAEGAEYRGYIERVPDCVKRILVSANGACNLAISEHAASNALYDSCTTSLSVMGLVSGTFQLKCGSVQTHGPAHALMVMPNCWR
jgi:hypothetical protein